MPISDVERTIAAKYRAAFEIIRRKAAFFILV
jgi:hypothetical protein